MLTYILIAFPFLLIAFLGWRHLSKSGKVPSIELKIGAGTKKNLLISVGVVVVVILLFGVYTFGLHGLVLTYLPWPVAVILGLALLLRVKALQPFASMGIMMVAGWCFFTWVRDDVPTMAGNAVNGVAGLISGTDKNPCASQNNQTIPKEGMFVTLCSKEKQHDNIISLKRIGQIPIVLEWSEKTKRDFPVLGTISVEEFVYDYPVDSPGDNNYIQIMPLSENENEKWLDLGLGMEPLTFWVTYEEVGGTNE